MGICLIGKSGVFTQDQLNKSLQLVYELEKQFEEIEIYQHSELDQNKPHCAGLDLEAWKKNYEIYKEALEPPEKK